jgi:aspartyl-tRNA synthetase
MLETKPERVRAKAYDIVLNGYEIGGGSIRIYDNELQKRMFKALGFSEEEAYERFGFLLDAFRYGTPPHGGMAYGLDRLVMIMANCDNIRDVIAFPKVQNASCLMTGAPGMVEEKQLKELNIKIEEE